MVPAILAWTIVLSAVGAILWLMIKFPYQPPPRKTIELAVPVEAPKPVDSIREPDPTEPSSMWLAIAKACGLAAAYPVFMAWQSPYFELWSVSTLFVGLTSGIFSATALAIGMVYEDRLIRFRSFQASQILKELKQNVPITKEFVLFLRPFYLDNMIATKNPAYSSAPILPSHYNEDQHAGLERVLTDAESPKLLIALNNRIGSPPRGGIGYVAESNAEWKSAVRILAQHASRIFVIPGSGRNSLWEIALLKRRKWLTKTVMILPPSTSVSEDLARQASDEWANIQKRLSRRGIESPGYVSSGYLFTVGADGVLNGKSDYRSDGDWVRDECPKILKPREEREADEYNSWIGRQGVWIAGVAVLVITTILIVSSCG